MEKSLTFSQVIDTMEFGEVAVKIGGYEEGRFITSGMYIFFNENDNGALTTNEGIRATPAKSLHSGQVKDRFVIMSREAYNKMKNL